MQVVGNPDSELFAMEAANLFFEQSTELAETLAAIRALPPRAHDHRGQEMISATIELLQRSQMPTTRVMPLQEGRDEYITLKKIEQAFTDISL